MSTKWIWLTWIYRGIPIDHAVILPSSPGLRWIGGLSNLSIVVQPLLRHLSHQQGGSADRLLSNQQTCRWKLRIFFPFRQKIITWLCDQNIHPIPHHLLLSSTLRLGQEVYWKQGPVEQNIICSKHQWCEHSWQAITCLWSSVGGSSLCSPALLAQAQPLHQLLHRQPLAREGQGRKSAPGCNPKQGVT